MVRLFVVFRTFDRIWTCRTYTKELAPFEMDMSRGPIKLMFMVDQIMEAPNCKNVFLLNNYHFIRRNSNAVKDAVPFYCTPHESFSPKIVRPCVGLPVVKSLPNGAKQGLMRRFSVPSLEVDLNALNPGRQLVKPNDVIYFVLPMCRCTVLLDAHVASSVSTECSRSRVFRKRFWKYLQRNGGFRNCVTDYENWTEEEREAWNNYLSVPYMIDVVAVWPKQKIDYAWSSKILGLLSKHIVLEESFAWLSTLGGAHSSLGEAFTHHAERAGQISVQQLKLAIELGNESLIARCYIFWSWSLLQQGELKKCRKCVLNTWKFCQSIRGHDTILENMCKAVWSRLRYKWSLVKSKHRLCLKSNREHRDRDDGGGDGDDLPYSARTSLVPKSGTAVSSSDNSGGGAGNKGSSSVRVEAVVKAPSMVVGTVKVC